MRIINLLLLPVLAILLFTSCDGSGFLSASSMSSEVLVIMEKDEWESETGRALFEVLNSPA